MTPFRIAIVFLASAGMAVPVAAQHVAADNVARTSADTPQEESSVTEHSIRLNGRTVPVSGKRGQVVTMQIP